MTERYETFRTMLLLALGAIDEKLADRQLDLITTGRYSRTVAASEVHRDGHVTVTIAKPALLRLPPKSLERLAWHEACHIALDCHYRANPAHTYWDEPVHGPSWVACMKKYDQDPRWRPRCSKLMPTRRQNRHTVRCPRCGATTEMTTTKLHWLHKGLHIYYCSGCKAPLPSTAKEMAHVPQ